VLDTIPKDPVCRRRRIFFREKRCFSARDGRLWSVALRLSQDSAAATQVLVFVESCCMSQNSL
jgi:hypothetical protein